MMRNLLIASILGLLGGIAIASLIHIPLVTLILPGVIAAACFTLWSVRRLSLFLIAALFLCGSVVGTARTVMAYKELSPVFASHIGETVTFEGVVVVDPDIRETTQRVTIEVQSGDEKTRLLAVAPLYPRVLYGQTVQVRGELKRPETFETNTGRTFQYDRFLKKDGVYALVENASLHVSKERSGLWFCLRGTLSDIKHAGIDALGQALPEPHASLASGLVLGGKQGLGETLLDDFIRVGLVHIVVLSGYNVMIVAEFVLRLFGFLPKRAASTLASIVIGMFVLAAGAGSASIRAGIMAGIGLYARSSGRRYNASRALIFAALLMVLWNPPILMFDPGFQLSFIATLGLIFGAPIIEQRLVFIKQAFLRDIVSSTIAAQIAVLPLLLFQNGLFSVVALPANILVLPVVPLAMLASAFAGLVGILVPALAPFFGLPAYAILSYIIGITEFLARVPLAAFPVSTFPFPIVVGAYSLLIWTVWRLTRTPVVLQTRKLKHYHI